jgi:hypothetical protein
MEEQMHNHDEKLLKVFRKQKKKEEGRRMKGKPRSNKEVMLEPDRGRKKKVPAATSKKTKESYLVVSQTFGGFMCTRFLFQGRSSCYLYV